MGAEGEDNQDYDNGKIEDGNTVRVSMHDEQRAHQSKSAPARQFLSQST